MNTWFQFKQFIVNQDKCAMKVGTDGVLLGSWTPVGAVSRIVDMGTGTGVIALMLAQRSKAMVSAIEWDMAAAVQAAENFAASPWPERLESICGSIQELSFLMEGQFDLAVSNPPFFPGHLLPPDQLRSKARHTSAAEGWNTWLQSAFRFTNEMGKAAFIVPANDLGQRLEIAGESGFFPEKIIHVRGHVRKSPKRVLLLFSKIKKPCDAATITIENSERGVYTREFAELVSGFYLK